MKEWKLHGLVGMALFVAFAAYFRTIILDTGINSDLNAHIGFAKAAFEGEGVWPRHILYFALVTLTSFWSASLPVWEISGWLWLSALVVAKFLATLWFGRQWLCSVHSGQLVQGALFGRNELVTLAIALGMTVVFCLPQPAAYAQDLWYAFSFPPNIWHNSTQIAVIPFAIVVFGLSMRQFDRPDDVVNALTMAGVAVLSALAKPSFLMAWLPAYGICTLLLLQRRRAPREFLIALLPAILAACVILAQYYFIYITTVNNTSVTIGYLDAWLSRAGRKEIHFYISILFSSLFPIVFYLAHSQRAKALPHVLSIGMVLISYIFASAVSEVGDTQSGNFMWPIISASFLSNMLCAYELQAISRSGTLTGRLQKALRLTLPSLLFATNVVWGIAYMIRYLMIGGYG